MVIHQLPRVAKGWNTHGLTQKQCDAYYMNDGTDCPGKDKEINRGDGSERMSGYVTKEDAVEAGRYKPLSEASLYSMLIVSPVSIFSSLQWCLEFVETAIKMQENLKTYKSSITVETVMGIQTRCFGYAPALELKICTPE